MTKEVDVNARQTVNDTGLFQEVYRDIKGLLGRINFKKIFTAGAVIIAACFLIGGAVSLYEDWDYEQSNKRWEAEQIKEEKDRLASRVYLQPSYTSHALNNYVRHKAHSGNIAYAFTSDAIYINIQPSSITKEIKAKFASVDSLNCKAVLSTGTYYVKEDSIDGTLIHGRIFELKKGVLNPFWIEARDNLIGYVKNFEKFHVTCSKDYNGIFNEIENADFYIDLKL